MFNPTEIRKNGPTRRPAPEPDPIPDRITDLEGAITKALTAGTGRAGRVGDHDELMQRLTQDGVRCDVADYYGAIGALIESGRVQYSSERGIWLSTDAA